MTIRTEGTRRTRANRARSETGDGSIGRPDRPRWARARPTAELTSATPWPQTTSAFAVLTLLSSAASAATGTSARAAVPVPGPRPAMPSAARPASAAVAATRVVAMFGSSDRCVVGGRCSRAAGPVVRPSGTPALPPGPDWSVVCVAVWARATAVRCGACAGQPHPTDRQPQPRCAARFRATTSRPGRPDPTRRHEMLVTLRCQPSDATRSAASIMTVHVRDLPVGPAKQWNPACPIGQHRDVRVPEPVGPAGQWR